MSGQRIIVIGGVAAGMSAASQAKRRQPSAEVVVFERGTRISYGACGMPYNIEDPSRDIEDLVVLTPDQALKRDIELRLRHDVVALDTERRVVTVRNLEAETELEEPYDALVIATGAHAIHLPLPGFDLPGIFHLRNLDHGRLIKSQIAEHSPSKAIVLGAGYVSMEMCNVLTELGLKVQILKNRPRILRGWSEETVAVVVDELNRHGVEIHTGMNITGAEAGTDGNVTALTTDQGPYPTDFILQAVGVQPNVNLAVEAGLRIGETGAIWVDQYQQTSAEGVWAAGDCAEAYHRILRRNVWIPLGTTANKHGRIAGANAIGAGQQFAGVVGTTGFKFFDLEVARSGLGLEQARTEGFEPVWVTIKQQSRAHAYPGASPIQVTLIADGPTGIFLGGEIVGREGAAMRANVLATALASHMTVADLQGLDLIYSPPFAPVWDPVLVAANQLIKKVGRTV
ncbi:MAG: FAD-dependent oxidoreductase [Thermoanaerobaculales bacterium]|nr:FAD-dependent oxidoreductase [Thermoanaerobaculales bacterium]